MYYYGLCDCCGRRTVHAMQRARHAASVCASANALICILGAQMMQLNQDGKHA